VRRQVSLVLLANTFINHDRKERGVACASSVLVTLLLLPKCLRKQSTPTVNVLALNLDLHRRYPYRP
jgi:hypothetical protein